MADFLNDGDRWLDRVVDGTGEIALEIGVSGTPKERERVLLDVPWELRRRPEFFSRRTNVGQSCSGERESRADHSRPCGTSMQMCSGN
jgi:hypothetical protein